MGLGYRSCTHQGDSAAFLCLHLLLLAFLQFELCLLFADVVDYCVLLLVVNIAKFLDAGLPEDLEALVHSLTTLGAHLDTGYSQFKGESCNIFLSDFKILAVSLVCGHDDLDLIFGVLLDLLEPEVLQVLKGLLDFEVKDQHDALRIFVVGTGNGPETFLTSGIPYLHLDSLVL